MSQKIKIDARIDIELENQIKALAKRENRSKSSMIQILLYEGVKVLLSKNP